VLRLLRGPELTVDELAAGLGVTPNAARFHLAELERTGLVAQRAVRRGPRKPSSRYSLTARSEAPFPKRYDALLNAVLHDVRADHSAGAVAALFRRLGRQLAARDAHRFAGSAGRATHRRH
jgi:predicted ArsR family transcriptional regulator